MKKKFLILLIISTAIGGVFFLNYKNSYKKPVDKLILSDYQLESYINIRGWTVTKINADTVKIPLKFNNSFKNFADEMKNSGFDLESHKGEEVKRFTYSVDNYGESGIIAELLLTSENELISAALIQQKPDGFIKAL